MVIGTFFSLAMVTTVHVYSCLPFGQHIDGLGSLSICQSITDAYQYFVNNIDPTENNRLSKVQTITCSYHLDKLLPASARSSLCYLIISAESTA